MCDLKTEILYAFAVPIGDAGNPFTLELQGKSADTLARLINAGRKGDPLTPESAACVTVLASKGLNIAKQTTCPDTGDPYMRPHYVLLDDVKVFLLREAMLSAAAGCA